MSSVKSVKTWFQIHKWTSLICTLFLLMLCLTGLPLIFHEEIEELEGKPKLAKELPAGTKAAGLDKLETAALAAFPKKVVRYIYWDEHEPNTTTFSLSDSINAAPDNFTTVIVDDRTAEVLEAPNLQEGFMYIMLQMHIDMFMGIGGKLFLGLMGLLFVAAIISGMMLYSPIMKRFNFGMVRTEKSTRLKWLDLHNLLGVVTIVWGTVVGLTGVINTMSEVVLGLWQVGQLSEMTAPYKNAQPLTGKLSSLDGAMAVAEKAAPEMEPSLVAYPGTPFTSKHHYAVFMKGNTPLTKRIIKPALVDAKTGSLTDMRDMPWYVNTLFVSQPLHFGDYGGLPLKIIWALFDIATIVILGSGLYLWFARNKANKAHLNRLNKRDFESLTVLAEKEN
ncbi:PepSY-associated TM helix domain-containing protein [Dyadobacter fanqingshengii]|uniref:PepSY domain-containing protein n=1 Tax=Dyadobacter fanqingshengii TaxID=2906443 RepID=A0A9X1PC66_9BACT|nr:PepSY domain-containing protein [Dyadobacter fanqingshengii]MCF0041233.1 PepSY domain-containing protein [Dyadobacter fanqingshengii]USJ37042.1 PepSY domain-containing protein [Dyadobacter fanqingshengii]